MNAKPDDQDPSMDDILASIRRIMLDEQARLKESGPAPQEPPRTSEQEELAQPVLVLDDSMAVHEPPAETMPAPEADAPSPQGEADAEPPTLIMTMLEPIIVEPVMGGSHAPESEAVAPAAPEPAAPEPATRQPAAPEPTPAPSISVAEPTGPFSQLDAQALEALLAPAAAAAATASVDAMLRQLQSERESFLQGDAGSGPSLEQVVRGEIRPMLKVWLDEHLPDMVERLVRAELARLTLATGRRL